MLSQREQQQLQESLLGDEAFAKFSTAAALVAKLELLILLESISSKDRQQ